MYNNKYLATSLLAFFICSLAVCLLIRQFVVFGEFLLLILAICFGAFSTWLGYFELWKKAFRIKHFDRQSLKVKSFSGKTSFSPMDIKSSKTKHLKSRFGIFNETQIVFANNSRIILSDFYLKKYKESISAWRIVSG